MADQNASAGIAALSICESLLLALNDNRVLSEAEIRGVLEDAAASLDGASVPGEDGQLQRAASASINRILTGGNTVRSK
ncbi:MAG: hypothetical protein RIB61_00055 [Roseicyclus sp.]